MTEELTGQVGNFLPHYDPPGLSVRATFLATDGSRPQEIILEWRNDPGRETLDFALDAIMDMARPSEVRTVVERTGRLRPTEGPWHGRPQAPDSLAETVHDLGVHADEPLCLAAGPGHNVEGHGCVLRPGHPPVEEGGRAHRCACGGIFGTDEEHPSVPGRQTQRRRRGEE